MPLSNVLEWIIELTARTISAVSSMMAGVLPAPTPTAGLPEEYAALTIPGPPVARIISASFMTRFVISRLGVSIHSMMPSGAPALTAASRITFAAAAVDCLARGWGLMMIAFLVLRASRHLKMAVEVGLVVGMTAAITPTGSAIFFMPYALSSSIIPQVFVFL